LLEGEIRSAFAMTEPDVASSDATQIATSIVRDGDEYVINGRKWWTTNALHPNLKILIVMGKTDPSAATYQQQSMVLVPSETAGVVVKRSLPVFGYHDPEGHGELEFTDVRVPVSNIIAGEGMGFLIAQARLGPGRIHHCMRAIGLAERALEMMCERADARSTFGKPVSANANIRDWIAESRIGLEMARLLVWKTAWLMDTIGNQHARVEISGIKFAVPEICLQVLDRAIQVHGDRGVPASSPPTVTETQTVVSTPSRSPVPDAPGRANDDDGPGAEVEVDVRGAGERGSHRVAPAVWRSRRRGRTSAAN
jgi:acyl-CoA dehydrogenase